MVAKLPLPFRTSPKKGTGFNPKVLISISFSLTLSRKKLKVPCIFLSAPSSFSCDLFGNPDAFARDPSCDSKHGDHNPLLFFYTSTGALSCKPGNLWFGKVMLERACPEADEYRYFSITVFSASLAGAGYSISWLGFLGGWDFCPIPCDLRIVSPGNSGEVAGCNVYRGYGFRRSVNQDQLRAGAGHHVHR